MNETIIRVPGKFIADEYGTPLAITTDIYDESFEKYLSEINSEIIEQFSELNASKQNKLEAGPNINIEGNIISAINGGDRNENPIVLFKWESIEDTPSAPSISAENYLNNTNLNGWSKTAPNRANNSHLWMTLNALVSENGVYSLNSSWSSPVRISGDRGEPGTGLNNRGNWVSGSVYTVGDYVFSRSTNSASVNSMWIAKTETFTSTALPYLDTTNWIEFLAPKGDKGDKGDPGEIVKIDSNASSIMYAISTSSTTPPSSGWSSSIPQAQKGKYLWTRDITVYDDGTSTTTYGVSYYGTDGTDGDDVKIDTNNTYVRYSTQKTSSKPEDSTFTLTSPPSLSQGDYLWILSQTAYVGVTNPLKSYSVSRVGTDGDDGDPGADGYTTHFAYAISADGLTGFSTTSFNGASYIGTYRDQNAADSTNPADYVWTLWKGDKGDRGNDGTSPIFADLTNEMDSVACNSNGVTEDEQYVETYVGIWKGDTKLAISGIACKIGSTSLGTSYASSTSSIAYYYKMSVTPSTGYVKITVRNGATITSKTDVTVTVTSTIDGASVSRDLTITINGVKKGANGAAAIIYSLVPSVSAITKKKDGTVVPNGNVTCSVVKTTGNSQPETVTNGFTLTKKVNGGSEVSYSATTASTVTSQIEFFLYVNSVLVDKETVPVVADGIDGVADVWSIGSDGYWYKNGVKQNVKAEGSDGTGIELKGAVATVSALGQVTGMSYGDCYMVNDNGWLYFYDGTTPASSATSIKPANPTGWNPIGEIKGETGNPGTTYYYHIAWATSVTFDNNGTPNSCTGFTTTKGSTNYDWMGICTDTSASDPSGTNAYKSYKWNYVKGPKGDNVTISSTSVTYAVTLNSTLPSNSSFSYNQIPSISLGDYLWSKTTVNYSDGNSTTTYSVSRIGDDGDNGTPGAKGDDGKTSYLHIAYANSANGSSGFSTTYFDGALYIGTCTNYTSSDPTTYTSYEWARLKGEQGPKGDTGSSVTLDLTGSYVEYAFSQNGVAGTGRQYPSDITLWSRSIPTAQQGKYLWIKDVTAYIDGGVAKTTTTYGVSYYAQDGSDVQIDTSRTFVKYSTQKTSSQPTDSTFTLTSPPSLAQGDYLWILSLTAYVGVTNPLKSYSVSRVGTDGNEGDAGADGYTTHFAYATSADGSLNFSTSNFVGATYIGTYRDQIGTDSTDRTKYTWTQWKGDKGASVTVSSTSVTYQKSSSGTTTPSGTWVTTIPTTSAGEFLWTKTVVTYSDGNSSTSYSVSRNGTNGTNGTNGADGTSVTVASTSTTYAVTNNNTQPSNFPYSSVPSVALGQYLWSKQVVNFSDGKSINSVSVSRIGADGSNGTNGANGSSTHFAYATSANGQTGFSTTLFAGATYIGTYTDTTVADSTDYTKYSWTKLKGDDAISIASVTEYYLISASSSGVTTSTSGWGTSFVAPTSAKKYLWNYEKITYSDGTYTNTVPVIIGNYAADGTNGRGIQSITEYYKVSSSNTGVSNTDSGWSTSIQTMDVTNKYLWNYELITYTDGTTAKTTAVIIGVHGETGPQGPQGIQGPAGTSVMAQYSADNSSWHTTFLSGDKWMRTSTNSGSTWTSGVKIIGENGSNGTNGTNGKNGDYIDYSFGISAAPSTATVQTAPSGVSEWADGPIDTTSAKPYLWCRQIPHTFTGSTETVGSASYIRLTPIDGVVYTLEGPIDNITIPSGQTSTTLTTTVSLYSKVGDLEKSLASFYIFTYSRNSSGTVTWFEAGTPSNKRSSVTISNRTVSNSVKSIGIVAFPEFIANTIAEQRLNSGNYLAKKEIVVLQEYLTPQELPDALEDLLTVVIGSDSAGAKIEINSLHAIHLVGESIWMSGTACKFNNKSLATEEYADSAINGKLVSTTASSYAASSVAVNPDRFYPLQYDKNGKLVVGVPWTDANSGGTVTQVKVGTTAYNPSSGVVSLPAYPSYNNATTSVAGLMSAADKTSLNTLGSIITKDSNGNVSVGSSGNVAIGGGGNTTIGGEGYLLLYPGSKAYYGGTASNDNEIINKGGLKSYLADVDQGSVSIRLQEGVYIEATSDATLKATDGNVNILSENNAVYIESQADEVYIDSNVGTYLGSNSGDVFLGKTASISNGLSSQVYLGTSTNANNKVATKGYVDSAIANVTNTVITTMTIVGNVDAYNNRVYFKADGPLSSYTSNAGRQIFSDPQADENLTILVNEDSVSGDYIRIGYAFVVTTAGTIPTPELNVQLNVGDIILFKNDYPEETTDSTFKWYKL